MECCVGVSIETVLQIVKFYTVVNAEKILKTDVWDSFELPEIISMVERFMIYLEFG